LTTRIKKSAVRDRRGRGGEGGRGGWRQYSSVKEIYLLRQAGGEKKA
jgi:hypothetical protein